MPCFPFTQFHSWAIPLFYTETNIFRFPSLRPPLFEHLCFFGGFNCLFVSLLLQMAINKYSHFDNISLSQNVCLFSKAGNRPMCIHIRTTWLRLSSRESVYRIVTLAKHTSVYVFYIFHHKITLYSGSGDIIDTIFHFLKP